MPVPHIRAILKAVAILLAQLRPDRMLTGKLGTTDQQTLREQALPAGCVVFGPFWGWCVCVYRLCETHRLFPCILQLMHCQISLLKSNTVCCQLGT